MIRERTAKMSLGPLFWTPTIEGLLNYEYFRDHPEALDDPAWQADLPAAVVADIKKSLVHVDRLPYFQLTAARRPTLAHKFKQLHEAGVVPLIGTDSGIPMNFHTHSTWRELDAWVNMLGVDPITAIRAATYWPSVAMKVDAPASIPAVGGKFILPDNRETPDTILASYQYPGFVMTYENRTTNGRTLNDHGYGIEFYGTEGTLFVDRSGFEVTPESRREGDQIVDRTAGRRQASRRCG